MAETRALQSWFVAQHRDIEASHGWQATGPRPYATWTAPRPEQAMAAYSGRSTLHSRWWWQLWTRRWLWRRRGPW